MRDFIANIFVSKVVVPVGYVVGKPTYLKPIKTKKLSKEQLLNELKKEMLKIHTKRIEHLFIMDECGNVLFRNTGNNGSVHPPSYEFFKNHEGERLICVHNHPHSDKAGRYTIPTFSAPDLASQSYTVHQTGCLLDEYVCHYGEYFVCEVVNPKKLLHQSTIKMACRRMKKEANISVYGQQKPIYMEIGETNDEFNKRKAKRDSEARIAFCEDIFRRHKEYFNTSRGCNYYRGKL